MRIINTSIEIICTCLIIGVTGYAQKTNVYAAGNEASSDNYDPSGYRIWGNYRNETSDANELDARQLPSFYYKILKNRLENNYSPEEKRTFAPAPLSRGMAVGSTAGMAEITLTGAANYSVPIEVPEGIAGFKPEVSVRYSSQSGVGLLGYGWNLSAFSVISRSGKTFYHDGMSKAPALSYEDNVMLDGQRLMLISGQNLMNGAKYRLENDPTIDITYKMIGSFQGFTVRSKDGTIREFGVTSDSNIETPGGATLCWLLSRVVDKQGNVISYQYEETVNNGEFYLNRIEYASGRSIRFSYETRKDKQRGYYAGAVLNSNKILKSISTYIGQMQFKQYQFNYNTYENGLYTQLTEIIESGQNGQRYNPTRIYYGYPDPYKNEDIVTLSEHRKGNKPLFADFNGDGRMDFLSYPEELSDNPKEDVATLFLSLHGLGGTYFAKKCTIPMRAFGEFRYFMLADVNGDKKMDVIHVSRADNGTERYNYYVFDGEKLVYQYKGFNTHGDEAFVGDFDGDGRHDILIKNNSKVYDGEGREIASGGITDWGSDYIKYYYPNSRYICDLNGNGKSELLVIDKHGAKVYELNERQFVELPEFRTSQIKNYYFPYFGDFNGDGKTDVLIQRWHQGDYDDVSILFSTGKGYVKQDVLNADIRAKVFVADFNKDGKSDIFHMEIVNNAVRMKVGIFHGNGFHTTYHSSNLRLEDVYLSYNNIEYDHYLFQVADFDGDGSSEFCCARHMNAYIIRSFSDPQNLLVETISDGLGAYTSFQYAPITSNSICTVTGNNEAFPVTDSRFPLYVVSNITQSTGGYSETTRYRYKDPRSHMQGKGFLGFGEVESIDDNKDRKVITTYGYEKNYFYPYMKEQQVTTRSGTKIATSVYENSYVYNDSKRVVPYVRKSTTTDHLTGVVKTIECTQVDAWANPLKIVTRHGNDVTETVTASYINSEAENRWIIGLPQSVEKRVTKETGTWIDKQIFTYNAGYLPQKIVNFTGDGNKQTSEDVFDYDRYGNMITHSTRAYASPHVLTTKKEYSSDGLYMLRTIDPLSRVTTYTYNSSGQLALTKDFLNTTTAYEYDGMGRLVKTVYPDQTQSSVVYSWENAVVNSVYGMTETLTGKPERKIYFDAFGRKVRECIRQTDGQDVCTDTKYDNAGRVSQESLPFKGGAASKWNTYGYDGYGRLSQQTHASGKTTTYTYAGNSITETKNGISHKSVYNAMGEQVSVTDPAGTITYTLRPDGQPVTITAPGNVKTTFSYDAYGRQTAIHDPSAGNRTFAYDASGNLQRETDADNRVKTMSYDVYGRLTSKVLPEFTTSYAYNGYGQLTTETSNNGISSVYEYDSYGRLAKERNNVPDGKWLEKTYTYAAGNLASVRYASQSGAIGTEAYTYSHGHMNGIRWGSSPVWTLNAENPFSQPLSVTTGPVTRTYTYDVYGIPTGRTAQSTAGGTFLNSTYGFDAARGNLTYRKDNRRNKQENFTYDNLNRLKTYGGIVMDYDPKGNITKKGDVGTFHYQTPHKPYALSGADIGTNKVIPPREQTIRYTSFDRPSVITENGYEASFIYNASGDRQKMTVKKGGKPLYTRYYLGGRYETDVMGNSQKHRLYIGGDAYTAPAVYMNTGNGWALYYICRDYLGNMTHLVDRNGTVVQELSYDAWGRLRNPETHAVYLPDNETELLLGRGYTGHEHLPMFGLINMNARLYDPVLGRFLSPDPYVQMPDFSQNFNRYSYCLNNPLVYVDEDGEFVHLIIGAVVGGAINVIANWKTIQQKGFWAGVGYFGVGAGVGALSAAGGAWVATTFKAVGVAAGAGVGAVSGGIIGGGSSFILNGGNNLIAGNNFFDDWKSSLASGAIGGAISGGIGGGIKGYNNAKKLGANRWTGYKATHRGHFSIASKTGILPQQDPTKHCYSVSGEYADAGHNNFTRTDFQKAAARLNNGLVPNGADIGLVAREAGLNVNVVKMGTSNLLQFGTNLQQGTMEGILTIGSNLNAGHTVNVISFDVIEKLNILGGGSKFLMNNTRVWDPLTGSVKNLTENIMKFVFIKY